VWARECTDLDHSFFVAVLRCVVSCGVQRSRSRTLESRINFDPGKVKLPVGFPWDYWLIGRFGG
jgi:hypothetical protein